MAHYLELTRPDRGGRDHSGEISRQADAAGPRPSTRPRASAHLRIRSRPSARRPPGSYPVDRHGGQQPTSTATARRSTQRLQARRTPEDRHLPAGVPQAHGADVERLLPLEPAIRLVKGAYDEPAAVAFRSREGSTPTTSGSRSALARREPHPPDPAGPRHARRRADRADRGAAPAPPACPSATASRSRCCTGSGRTSSSGSRKAGYRVLALIAYGAALVPVVHAPSGGAAGERDVRHPLDAAVGTVMAGGTRPRVFVSRLIPDAGLDPIREACDAEIWTDELPPSRADLLRLVRGCDGLLTLLTERIDAALLESGFGGVRVVSANWPWASTTSTSPPAPSAPSPSCNTPGVLADTTADLAFYADARRRRLAMARRTRRTSGASGRGGDIRQECLGLDVHGATLGIVGIGQIGRAVARRAAGFAMGVPSTVTPETWTISRRERGTSSVSTAAREVADIVSLHVPAVNVGTRHLIAAPRWRQMKPTAVLVNTARGPVVDPEALVEALRAGRPASRRARRDRPRADGRRTTRCLTLPNCLIVPHIAGNERDPRRDRRDGRREPARGGPRRAAADRGAAA